MASIRINGETVKVKNGTTILNACASIGIKIPTLCFIEEINEIGFCRICVVEVMGEQDLVSACNTEVKNGMEIETDSEVVLKSRANTLQLLAGKHRFDCWRCPKDGICEFYDLLKKYDIVFEEFGPGIARNSDLIFGTGVSQDQSKCVLCKRCVAVCNEVAAANVLKFRDDDGMNPIVSPTIGLDFDATGCTFCGQCVKVCPTGTLFETDHIAQVEDMIKDSSKEVIVQIAPSVSKVIGEEFGYDVGISNENIEGKMNRALKLIGFDQITDISLGEDLTIIEEAEQLMNRLKDGGTLPLFTSSCPAAVRYTELYQPSYLENLSTTKSSHVAQGSLIKNYFGKEFLKKEPKDIKVVSIMPCTAKKYEISRGELEVGSERDVDAVLTVRELAKMIKKKALDFSKLEPFIEESNVAKLIQSEGKSRISKCELEKVLNIVSIKLDNKPLDEIKYKIVRGKNSKLSSGTIKEATVTIGGNKLNVAVVQGGAAMKEMFKTLNSSKKNYHFIEFMGCPGGCVNGGGMPVVIDLPMHEVIKRRTTLLNSIDNEDLPLRIPLENEKLLKVYDEFFTEKENLTKYCHTHFTQKEYRNE